MKSPPMLPDGSSFDSVPAHIVNTVEPSRPTPPFMRLPLELRLTVYHQLMPKPRREPTRHEIESVYIEDNMKDHWRDRPWALLFLSKQVHAEVSESLKKNEICLNVTGQGIALDESGLSATIAQNGCRNLDKVSHLRIEVWPPRPDRPVEAFYIWKDLQRLRNKIISSSRIQRLTLTFKRKGQFDWVSVDGLQHMLDLAAIPWQCSDLRSFLDLFASVTNVQHVDIGLDKAIRTNRVSRECQELTKYASRVARIMRGSSKAFTGLDHIENFTHEYLESKLKQVTARWALRRLNETTLYGRRKLTNTQYNMFVKRWPYFETLPVYDEFRYKMRDHEVLLGSTVHPREQFSAG
ncbi:MAG: hypothetical protein Q9205_003579 [Flavoplaca limonia]